MYPNQKQNLNISGYIYYKSIQNFYHSFLQPNIMGPFSYISFLECYHAILNMKILINGYININKKKIQFENDDCYIEKDWGFPFLNHIYGIKPIFLKLMRVL